MAESTTMRSRLTSWKMGKAFLQLLKGRPGLWGSFCCFWLWPWLLSNTSRRSGIGSLWDDPVFGAHLWLSLFLILAVTLLVIALLYRSGRFALGARGVIGIGCVALPMAGAASLLCVFGEPVPSAVWWVASATWLLPGGVGIAFMCLAWGRAFGRIGSASTLFVGVISTVVASVSMFVVVGLPVIVAKVALVAVAVLCAALLAIDYRLNPGDYEDGVATRPASASTAPASAATSLELPWKLLVTVFVWALAFGAVSNAFDAGDFWSTYGVPAYVAAAVVLLVCALRLRVDFNHLIYKVGFVAMAFGLLLMILLPKSEMFGYALFSMGYRFIELLVWALCAHLVYSRGVSPTWIVPLSVGVWTLGRWIGYIGSFTVAFGLGVQGQSVLALMLFVLLATALFLTSRGNLAEGWGIERIGVASLDAVILHRNVAQAAKTYGLSPREEEVLGAIMAGQTRSQIARTFVVSEETVKTHVKHVYRKLGVNSREELSQLVNEASAPASSGLAQRTEADR